MGKKYSKAAIATVSSLLVAGLCLVGVGTTGVILHNNNSNTKHESPKPNDNHNTQTPDNQNNGSQPPIQKPEEQVAPPKPVIGSVNVTGERNYEVGDTISLNANVTMASGEIPYDLTYQWYWKDGNSEKLIEDQHTSNLQLEASQEMNTKSIICEVSYDSQTYTSDAVSIYVTPKPIPEIHYNLSVKNGSIIISNITNNSANVSFSILSQEDLSSDFKVSALLNSQSTGIDGQVSKVSSREYSVSFNLTSLSADTQYELLNIKATINGKEYDVNNTNRITFKTLKQTDSIIAANVGASSINSDVTTNTVTIRLDQILPTNVGRSIRVLFKNGSTDLFSSTTQLVRGTYEYTLQLTNINAPGEYVFKEVQIDNGGWNKISMNASVTCSFIKAAPVIPDPLPPPTPAPDGFHYSDKPLSERGNIYRLQGANELFKDTNVNDYYDGVLSESTLKSGSSAYTNYFAVKNESPSTPNPTDQVPVGLTPTTAIDIGPTIYDSSTNEVQMLIKSSSTLTVNSAKALVKGYDQDHPWSKLITLTKDGSVLKFSGDLLSSDQNKYVITNLIVDDKYVANFSFQNGYIFTKSTQVVKNLSLANFAVYKDSNDKKLYGSVAFNASVEQLRNFKDKVFAFEFKSKQNTEWRKTDIWGQTTNLEDEYNTDYATPDVKRIYIPFDQLSQFRMDGFQEQIKYTLDNVEILSQGSLEPYSNVISLKDQNKYFAYTFDWNRNNIDLINQLYQENDTVERITKAKLVEQSKQGTSEVQIPYSINNFATLLDYNFDLYNALTRYRNAKTPPKERPFVLMKGDQRQKVDFFMPRELMPNTIFKINSDKHSAYVEKDLNSIVGLKTINPDDAILWLTFELDLNPIRSRDTTELGEIQSRIRVPISLGNLRTSKRIEDADFLFDPIQGLRDWQEEQFSKIKSNVKFNISLSETNQLKLEVVSRNNGINLTNKLWMHDNSPERSAYISNCSLFVNWVQPETTANNLLSFNDQQKLDDLTQATTAIGYENSYELKVKDRETYPRPDDPSKTFRTAEDIIDYPMPVEDTGRRLFKKDKSTGIDTARSRVFSLNKISDGTWNIIGKVNNKEDDYRFYAFANYHVWNASSIEPKVCTKTEDAYGNMVLKYTKPDLVSPTVADDNGKPKEPIYKQADDPKEDGYDPNLSVTGNVVDGFYANDGLEPISMKLFKNFYNFDTKDPSNGMRNNIGQKIDKRVEENKLDMIISEIDLSPIFKMFDGQNLSTVDYHGRHLTETEQQSIAHFLSFKNLKPMGWSDLSLYMSSFTNLNLYIASLPKRIAWQNPYSYLTCRYREYLIANNSIKIKRTYLNNDNGGHTPYEKVSTDRPTIETETRYFDIQSGSSGSGVYDYQGNVIAIDTQGGVGSSSNYVIMDTPRYSFIGNESTIYNNTTFYSKIKKMNYLYPTMYQDIFKTNK